MSTDPDVMDRARTELAVASLLADNGFASQAVSRAYYAAFYASEAALLHVGEVRSKHSGVVSAVARSLVVERGLSPEAGRLLRSLFERRSRADDGVDDTPAEEATQAVVDAVRVVTAIDEWFAHHSAGS